MSELIIFSIIPLRFYRYNHLYLCLNIIVFFFNALRMLRVLYDKSHGVCRGFCRGAPTYRKNEHSNIQGKSAGIILRG